MHYHDEVGGTVHAASVAASWASLYAYIWLYVPSVEASPVSGRQSYHVRASFLTSAGHLMSRRTTTCASQSLPMACLMSCSVTARRCKLICVLDTI